MSGRYLIMASHIRKYISPCGSIYDIVALKVQVWCTFVFWACGMQIEYVCICSTHAGAGISVDSTPAMQAL